MILKQVDIDEFVEAYSDLQVEGGFFRVGRRVIRDQPSLAAEARFNEWILENPQIMITGGFQEYVGAHKLPLYRRLAGESWLADYIELGGLPLFRLFSGQWLYLWDVSTDRNQPWLGASLEGMKRFRRRRFREWEQEQSAWKNYVELQLFSFDDLISSATRALTSGWNEAGTFISPKLWTPGRQASTKHALESCALSVIRQIQTDKIDLGSVHWKTFEDLVAELLRSAGMEVYRVEDSPQGGRDIIARASLIPGIEPVTVAVEVKHRGVVDRPEVQLALYQNRQFPALIFVTSGRFTAGVLEEARRPENRLRLFLKNGVAIRELPRRYPL